MAPRSRSSRWRLAVAAALALALSPAADAAARKFQMSGTWIVRNGQVFIPLQFAFAGMDASGNAIRASLGNLTGAVGFPNDAPIPGQGGVTATGSAPATLRIPAHRFVEDAMALVPSLFPVSLVQVTTNFGIDAPYAAATLAPGLGPGSFTWCPGDPACAAGGGMRSTDPPQGAVRNGRVIYRSGANRFGGVLQLGLRRGGDDVFTFNAAPFQAGHARFGMDTLQPSAVGGLGSADAPSTRFEFRTRLFVTQPTMPPTIMHWVILYPGPKLTTMLGLSTTGSGGVFYHPTPPLATGPMGTQAGQFTTHYGFGQTTGTVIAQQTAGSGGQDFFTVMGSDARTALGAGELSLVAGGLAFRNTPAWTTPYASFHEVRLTLAPPIPSLSPSGVAAAAALLLLAAGWALRRRF